MKEKLKIGDLYYFDSRFTSYGELIKIDHKGHAFFKSKFNDNENYHEENGLIEFATQGGFYPYQPTNANRHKI
jgi:hypothetical protein